MRKNTWITTFLLMMSISITYAQERILDELFQDVTVARDITYGQNYSILTGSPLLQDLKMDVYTPVGDTSTRRPLIILMHSGSFLPNFVTGVPFGTKEDSCLVEMCTRFAKRGWVAVSMTYRLGWNPLDTTQELRAKGIVLAVYRAQQDLFTCIRYFKENASTYGVDTTKIVVGGSNSGAYVALAAASLNKASELMNPKFLDGNGIPFVDQSIWGDFHGKGGNSSFNNFDNPGHSNDFQMVLSLGGAVGDTLWQEPGEVPMVSMAGVADPGTPFNTGIVFVAATGNPVVEVSGAGDHMRVANRLGNQDILKGGNFPQGPPSTDGRVYEGLYPFYGAGFEPWGWYSQSTPVNPDASKQRAMAYIDTIMWYFSPRAYRLLMDTSYTWSGIYVKPLQDVNMTLSPNPAEDYAIIRLNDPKYRMEEVKVYNIKGQLVSNFTVADPYHAEIPVISLPTGTYLVKVRMQTGEIVNRKISVQ